MTKETNIAKNTSLIVTIGVLLFSAGGLFYVSYDTAKEAKAETKALGLRMTAAETNVARFEGIMSERTKNIQDTVKTIREDMTKLLENLELSEGSSDAKSKAQT